MRNKRSVPLSLFVAGGLCLVAGLTSAQVSPIPRCKSRIVSPLVQTSATQDCGSYSECQADSECEPTGGIYKSCGEPQTYIRYCYNYSGGTFNPTTGRCEGGVWSGPAYEDPEGVEVKFFTHPVYCSGSGVE